MTKIISPFLILLLFSIFHISKSAENKNGTETNDGSDGSSWKTSRKYKGLVLENGLKVILVSDPHATGATGSLHIPAGSMSNPKEVPGLAHLLEHMVFNGNTKYPEPEAFYKYVSANGGSVPASTAMDYTEYEFIVLNTALNGSLDHLFHMINSPLLLESSIREEVTVVNSEHIKNVPQDTYGYQQIERSTSRKDHPFNTFPTGNEETLWTRPQQLGINVRQELIKYYEKYYSSNLMTLAVLGNNNFTELEEMVVGIFSKFKNRNATMPTWVNNPPYGPSELGVKIEIVPKGGLQYLSLEFPIPEEDKDVFSNYYVSLMSRGGNQSFFEFLKSADLVNTLSVGITEKYRGFHIFYISLYLTDFGVIHHDEIAVRVFEFINLLRKSPPQEWFWDEVKEIEDIEERFQTRDGAAVLVSSLGKLMIEYNPEEAIREYFNATRIQFNTTQVANVLNYVTPENMRMYFVSEKLQNTTFVEPNFKLKYNVEPINPKLLKRLKTAVPNPRVLLPTRNEYLPKNFTIKTPPPNNSNDVPRLLNTTKFSRLWFLQDTYYKLPKVVIRIKLFNPYAYGSPVDAGLNYILQSVINDILLYTASAAGVAGTEVTITDVVFGLEISLAGYNDGIDLILYKIMETISSVSFTNENFSAAKELYRQSINDTLNGQPCTLADTDLLLTETYWSPDMLYEALEDITLDGLKLYYQKFMSRIKMEWLIFGNIVEEEAMQFVQTSEKFFIKKGSRPSTVAENKWQLRNVEIPKGTNWLHKMVTNTHSGTCTRVAFQTPKPTDRNLVKIILLADLMEQPTYVELRTKEQLGYDLAVYSSREIGYSSHTLEIYVQSERDPKFVEGRINQSLLKFRFIKFSDFTVYQETLKNMTEEEFDESVLVQWKKWNTISNKMETHAFTFWKEIFYGHYNFNRDSDKQAVLGLLTLKELQEFYDELIGFQTGEQRRLSIYVVPAAFAGKETLKTEEAPLSETTTEFDNMGTTSFPTDAEGFPTEISFQDDLNGQTTTLPDVEATAATPLFWSVTKNSTKIDNYLSDLQDSLLSLDTSNHLDSTFGNGSSPREAKTLKQLTTDFLNQTATEIVDVVAWKRDQYLYPTTGFKSFSATLTDFESFLKMF